jgi:hypothetical protein
MTEDEWFGDAHPADMLDAIRHSAAERKLRLFMCACCRHASVWPRYRDKESRRLIEVVERYAEGVTAWEQVHEAMHVVRWFYHYGRLQTQGRINRVGQAARMLVALTNEDAIAAAEEMIRVSVNFLGSAQGALLREFFMNPRHPVRLCPDVLAWNDCAVPRIAQGIYEERAFDRLPILHDALLDAGCNDEPILSHCYSVGPHVRGCWVVDLILAKS